MKRRREISNKKQDLSIQAKKLIRSKLAQERGQERRISEGTHATYSTCLTQISRELCVGNLNEITTQMAHDYLSSKRNKVSQKTLGRMRRVLNMCNSVKRLPRITSTLENTKKYKTRQMPEEHIKQIFMCIKNSKTALSIKIVKEAALRAKEILTIRRIEEQPPSKFSNNPSEDWSALRFLGGKENWKRYTVQGKNGWIREVRLSPQTAAFLEQRLLAVPIKKKDRGIPYTLHYDIYGGSYLSRLFKEASYKALDYCLGIHALRHVFANNRFMDLTGEGANPDEAKRIIAQELGHKRRNSVDVYLR